MNLVQCQCRILESSIAIVNTPGYYKHPLASHVFCWQRNMSYVFLEVFLQSEFEKVGLATLCGTVNPKSCGFHEDTFPTCKDLGKLKNEIT